MDLLQQVSRKSGTAIILITHDLGLIAHVAHRVLVMYAGRVVESAPAEEIFTNPCHPYTKGLLNSMPVLGSWQTGNKRRLDAITGMVPALGNLPSGCPFHPRCPRVQPHCIETAPGVVNKTEDHWVRCVQ